MDFVDFILILFIMILYNIVVNYLVTIASTKDLSYSSTINRSIIIYILASLIAIYLYNKYKKSKRVVSLGLKYSSIVLLTTAILTGIPNNVMNVDLKLIILGFVTLGTIYYFEKTT